jgi:hypothetical protein
MNVRIVAAVPHNETSELEVILEVTRDTSNFMTETKLKSVWIDAEKLLEDAN